MFSTKVVDKIKTEKYGTTGQVKDGNKDYVKVGSYCIVHVLPVLLYDKFTTCRTGTSTNMYTNYVYR